MNMFTISPIAEYKNELLNTMVIDITKKILNGFDKSIDNFLYLLIDELESRNQQICISVEDIEQILLCILNGISGDTCVETAGLLVEIERYMGDVRSFAELISRDLILIAKD